MSKKKTPQDHIIVEYYNNNIISLRALAHKYGVSRQTITRILNRNNIKIKKIKPSGANKKIDISYDDLYNLYVIKNMSISAIAKYYNCSDVVIKKRISKYKIIKSKEKILDTIKSECINDYCWDNKKWLEDQYWKKKKSIREIASNVGSSEETIKSRLIKHNIKLRSLKEANKVSANSDEGRLLRSEISKDIWKNFDYKKRSSVIDKISMSLSGRNLTDKHKKNLSGTLKLKFKNPKCIKKHSNEMKKLWESPSYKMIKNLDNTNRALRDKSSHIYKKWRKNTWDNPNYAAIIRNNLLAISNNFVSKIEKIVGYILNDFNIAYCKIKPDGYEFDIFINSDQLNKDKNVLIEVNGLYWHKNNPRDKEKYEYWKNNLKNSHDFYYLWEHEFDVIGAIFNKLNKYIDLQPQKNSYEFNDLIIKKIDPVDVASLYNKYHYMMNRKSGYHIGAFLNDNLIAASTISGITRIESAKKQGVELDRIRELSRFCIHPLYNKKNLGSYLMSRFIKYYKRNNHKIEKLISFSDNTVGHDGALYKASGWKYDGSTNPSYCYEKDGMVWHKRVIWGYARKLKMKEKEFASWMELGKIKTKNKCRFIRDI